VLPGRWLKITDFLAGEPTLPVVTSASELRNDPRVQFIEDVNYTSPWTAIINGKKVGRTAQLLAQLGLSGIG